MPQHKAADLAARWVPLLQYLNTRTGLHIEFRTARDIPTFEQQLARGRIRLRLHESVSVRAVPAEVRLSRARKATRTWVARNCRGARGFPLPHAPGYGRTGAGLPRAQRVRREYIDARAITHRRRTDHAEFRGVARFGVLRRGQPAVRRWRRGAGNPGAARSRGARAIARALDLGRIHAARVRGACARARRRGRDSAAGPDRDQPRSAWQTVAGGGRVPGAYGRKRRRIRSRPQTRARYPRGTLRRDGIRRPPRQVALSRRVRRERDTGACHWRRQSLAFRLYVPVAASQGGLRHPADRGKLAAAARLDRLEHSGVGGGARADATGAGRRPNAVGERQECGVGARPRGPEPAGGRRAAPARHRLRAHRRSQGTRARRGRRPAGVAPPVPSGFGLRRGGRWCVRQRDADRGARGDARTRRARLLGG